MEFPDLGEHCSLKECRQLDFLPIKCSSCKQIFCSNHFRFEAHHCPVASEEEQKSSATSQDPVCPLCNRPVPIKAGESADYKVSEHIDKNCASEEREKVFKNRCSVGGCKRRELMPLT
ncbi:PREDICTED: AN1-type zinc finger protein 2A-like, partial [Rhagoletis zephyria]|uniref:AN1-type zinc finger protein 2A-like n=1 Tax=Rhagoletis zephyria TaxID=28612 RepID=UPI0008112063